MNVYKWLSLRWIKWKKNNGNKILRDKEYDNVVRKFNNNFWNEN